MRSHVVAGVGVTFYVANEKKPDSPSMHVIGTAWIGIAHADLVALCEAVCRRVEGKLPISQKRSLYNFVKPLLFFLQTPKVRWPGSSSEWQLFLLNFLRFYLLDRECSGASTETRIDHWMRRVTVELEFLKAEQLLPPDVAIPECKHKKEDVAASEQPLLGDQKRRVTAIEEPLRRTLPVTYDSSDPEFLESVGNAYRAKVDVLRRVCLEHWQAMKHDHAAGDRMMSTIPEKEVRSALHESVRRRKNKITSLRRFATSGADYGLCSARWYAKWGPKEGKGMGNFHPIAWYQEYDGGRAFYTGLGHLPATYSDANFLHHVYGGIYWAATGNGFTPN